MQKLSIDLKTFLSLVMPSQCCYAVKKEMFGWLVGEIFGEETQNLHDSYVYYNHKRDTYLVP